jgi:hypothetical protein
LTVSTYPVRVGSRWLAVKRFTTMGEPVRRLRDDELPSSPLTAQSLVELRLARHLRWHILTLSRNIDPQMISTYPQPRRSMAAEDPGIVAFASRTCHE